MKFQVSSDYETDLLKDTTKTSGMVLQRFEWNASKTSPDLSIGNLLEALILTFLEVFFVKTTKLKEYYNLRLSIGEEASD